MIIGIAGRARSGKSVLGNALETELYFEQRAFAMPIRLLIAKIFDWPIELVCSDAFKPMKMIIDGSTSRIFTGRDLLQQIGDSCKKQFGDNFWIERTLAQMSADNTVITDVRFPNELRAIKRLGGKIIRLNTKASLETLHDFVQRGPEDRCEWMTADQPDQIMCGLPLHLHPISWTPDQHPSERSLPDLGIHYDAVFIGDLGENTARALETVWEWLTARG